MPTPDKKQTAFIAALLVHGPRPPFTPFSGGHIDWLRQVVNFIYDQLYWSEYVVPSSPLRAMIRRRMEINKEFMDWYSESNDEYK